MAPLVEASSLSSITQLASNPPRYPRNPTEPKKEPLVLYISKVPGSPDIILTPFKPRLKNVTAEDVASSLYFLHLQSPDDEALQEEIDALPEEDEGSDVEPRPPLPERKPLPRPEEDGGSDVEVRPALPERKPLPNPVLLPPSTGIEAENPPKLPPRRQDLVCHEAEPEEPPPPRLPARKPVNQAPPSPIMRNGSPERHPLGPRPLSSLEPRIPRKLVPGVESQPRDSRSLDETSYSAESGSSLPYHPQPHPGPRPAVMNIRNALARAAAAAAVANGSATNPFCITIIRRDPTSGAQWNVGLISNHEPGDEGDSGPVLKSGGSLLIHLTTPGYNQFRESQAPPRRPASETGATISTAEADASPRSISGFHRRVSMEGSPNSFWDRQAAARRSMDLPSHARRGIHNRNLSASSSLGSIPAKPKSRHYVFTSPWHGRCEFSTGKAGRSLKCKHTLPPPPSYSSYSSSASISPSVPVSELRFNIPAAAMFGGAPQQHYHPSKSHARTASADSLSSSGSERDDSANAAADGHLDLSLGREAAGGGKHGKRAKLGKLIVYDEGLKMLDLLVAANMAIWWATWDP